MHRFRTGLVVAAVLLACVGMVGCKEKVSSSEETTSVKESQSTAETTSQGETAGGEDETTKEVQSPMPEEFYEINHSGVRFSIPKGGFVYLSEEQGAICMDEANGDYSAVFVVKDDSFDEFVKDSDNVTQGVRDKNYEITTDVTSCEKDGKKYAYFTYENGTDDFTYMLLYMGVGDAKRIGSNIMIIGDVEAKIVAENIAGFLAKSEITDAADTTADEIDAQDIISVGEKKDNSSLVVGEHKVTFDVPEGYKSVSTDADEESAYEEFHREDASGLTMATLRYYVNQDDYTLFENADVFFEEVGSEWRKDNSDYENVVIGEQKTTKSGALEITSVCEQYDYVKDGEKNHFSTINAIAITDNGCFIIRTVCIDGKDLDLSDIEDFLENLKEE